MILNVEHSRARSARLAERLRDAVYPETAGLGELAVAGPVGRIDPAEAQALAYRPAELPGRFGPLWATYWLHGCGVVPAAWAGQRVDLLWRTNCEATLWLRGAERGVVRRVVAPGPSGGLVVVEAPPYGPGATCAPDDEVTAYGLVLRNRHLRAELAPDGTLVSLVDRASGRETLAAPGNRLELYDDRPVEFDAWEIDPSHLATRRDAAPAESHTVAATPLRAEIVFERPLGEASRVTQTVRLDWHESHTLLKACFPLAVRSLTATYETAFGTTERSTHRSTSFDQARFEVPGHRFADLVLVS